MAEAVSAEPRYDLAVAGGGVIGAAVALGAAQRGFRVLLVERSVPERSRGRLGFDLRTLAVSPASRALLDGLGVWNSLTAAPYRRMEVWEERGTRAITFDAREVARSELGWIVENSLAVVELWAALSRQESVTVREAGVSEVRPEPDRVDLELAGEWVSAHLLIGADGAQSAVRERLGVAVRPFEVNQMALATVVRTARPHEDTAWQRFLLDGPVALLPTPDPHVCSVVWSQSPEQADRRALQDDAEFAVELERAVQSRLGAVEAVDRRLVFPLRQQLAASFNPHPRVLLIGDAARVVHPLAGHGANLGFEDVRDVLDVLTDLGPGADPGTAGLWRAFDRRRRTRSQLMIAVMGGLRQIYARGDPLTQWLRNTGVGWLDRATPVKRQLIVEAMGLGPVSRGLGRSAGRAHAAVR
ncbi:MAG TPA: FAD-dependent monooxygenase [Pseudomonadales bacterium]